MIIMRRGDKYFQHINHRNEGRLPVMYSISFANLKKNNKEEDKHFKLFASFR